MLINWKKEKAGLHMIPVMAKNNKIEKYIKLVPGFNDIDDKDWENAEKNSDVKALVDSGDIEVVKEVVNPDKEAKDKKIKVSSLKDLPANEAEKIIADTWDVDVLKSWKKKESRDSVRTTIMNQLENIEKAGTKK